MKTEVYSWRVSPELKARLEREARRRKVSMSAALDLAATEWLQKNENEDDAREQIRLRKAASRWIGALAGGDPHRAERASRIVRDKLRQQHGR